MAAKKSSPCCLGAGCGVSRRDFLKVAGVASISAFSPLAGAQNSGETDVEAEISHRVPADKNLPPAWVRSLFERGERRIYTGDCLETIGMPVGGIGTGQLYLRGDGTLGLWWIFNREHFTGVGEGIYSRRVPESPVDQGFAVAVSSGRKTSVRKLDRTGFTEVSFSGEYPIGTVRYQDPESPVEAELEAFSPFIPLNAKDSALPATICRVTVRNVSNRRIRAAVLGWLENAVCFHSAPDIYYGLRQSRTGQLNGRTHIVHSAKEDPDRAKLEPREAIVLMDFEGEGYGDWTVTGEAFGERPATGALPNQEDVSGFLGKGLVNTYLGGDEPQGTLTSPPFTVSRRFVSFLIGGGDHPGETCVNLLCGGKVVRTATGRNREQLVWHTWKVDEVEGKEAQIEIVDRHSGGWGHINVDHIELSDERRAPPTGPIAELEDCGTLALVMDGKAASSRRTLAVIQSDPDLEAKLDVVEDAVYPIGERLRAAFLSPSASLAPRVKRTFTFVLAWHFPNHEHGHEYVNRFADAAAVAHYVLNNEDRLTKETRTWHDTYYDSTLPYWLLDRIHWPVSTLATGTCQWWKNGRFWAWEGVGCCGGTCTHVWNYAHAHARLFPELARSVREMQDFGAGFNPETGLVGFRSNKSYAADGQCGTILKAYREHLMSADDSFLKRNWPSIKKALEYSIQQDGNNDGLIENTQHNTYDINFEGPNTFVGSLYLAAVRAAEKMATEAGDPEFAGRLRGIFEQGGTQSVQRLWDGGYFVQDVDLEKFPKHQYGRGCLADQLFGQGWAHQLALGYIYPKENVRQALQSVWTYNWAPDVTPQNEVHKPWRWFVDPGEAGLFVCTWPKSRHLDQGVLYQNEVWTGIEYQVAGHMIWEGMLTEGLATMRAVDDRYQPMKRNPYNEVECGDHYARALASWGVLIALSGYEYHGPKGHLGFAPRITPEDFRSAFTCAEGWGTFSQSRQAYTQREKIELRWGRLRLRSLAFALPEDRKPERVAVLTGGKKVASEAAFGGGRLEITLGEEVTIGKGQVVEAVIKLAP